MNIRRIILERLNELGWSKYRLTQAVKGRVPASNVYGYLRGDNDMTSKPLGYLLDALEIELTTKTNQGR